MRRMIGRRALGLALAAAVALAAMPGVILAQDERPDLKIEVVGLDPNDPRAVKIRVTNVGRWWADKTIATVEAIPPTAGAKVKVTEDVPDLGPKGDPETASQHEFTFDLAAPCSGQKVDVKAGLSTAKTFNGNTEATENLPNNADTREVCAAAVQAPSKPFDPGSGAVASACSRPLGAAASFQSVNVPDHFIRHSYSLGVLTPAADGLGVMDATFTVRPGLSGTPNSVSFESVNVEGQFLRHEHYRLRLSPRQETDLFRQDASFTVSGAGCRVRFESVNLPGHFIRHQDHELWLANDMAGARHLFEQDTTWEWQAPLYDGQLPERLRPGVHGDGGPLPAVLLDPSVVRHHGLIRKEEGPIGGCPFIGRHDPAKPPTVGYAFYDEFGCTYAGVNQLILNFDLEWLRRIEKKWLSKAELLFDEEVYHSTNDDAEPVYSATCVGRLGLAPGDFSAVIDRKQLLTTTNVEGDRLAAGMNVTSRWDVSTDVRWASSAHNAPLAGLVLHPRDENLNAETQRGCVSYLHNIRLKLEYTVLN